MIIYVVKKGDTLYSISKSFNVSIKSIIDANGIVNNNKLVVGEALVIPLKEELPNILVNGYMYSTISDYTLSLTLPSLTFSSIFNYRATNDGDLISIDDSRVITLSLDNNTLPILSLTNIGSSGRFDSDVAHDILISEDIQDKLINNLLNILINKGYDGVNVDFEYIYPVDKDLYNNFIMKISSILHENELLLITSLAPKVRADQVGTLYEAHDYKFHGEYADYVILMTYEWGYTYGPPMAVAPINQVERVISYAVSEIPSKKILMGVPNYGYDFTLPYDKSRPAKSISNTDAVKLASEKGVEIQFDSLAQTPYFYYKDSNDVNHVVWFEDARSIDAKLNLVNEYSLGGISIWTVMNYFPAMYSLLNSRFNVEKS